MFWPQEVDDAVRTKNRVHHMRRESDSDIRGWRPPEPAPRISPRTLARILLSGGVLIACFDVLQRIGGTPSVPIPQLGYLILVIWGLRALNLVRGFAMTGWWISILWHVFQLVSSVLLLPFALALAASASLLFLLPHFWVIAALLLSIVGLWSEKQWRLTALPTPHG